MMKRLFCILLQSLFIAILFASCGVHGDTGASGDVPGGFVKGRNEYIWGDFFFYDAGYNIYNVNPLRFHDLKNAQREGLPIGGDVLPFSDDEIFGSIIDKRTISGFSMRMLVDEGATEQNDGAPVLVVAYTQEVRDKKIVRKDQTRASHDETRIISFNMRTHETSVILDGIDGLVSSLCMYRNTVFFSTTQKNAYDENGIPQMLSKVDRDGGGYTTLEGGDEYLSIDYIHDDVIYLSSSTRVYSCNLDFGDMTCLFEVPGGGVTVTCVDGEYIYYLKEKWYNFDDSGEDSVCRRKLSDITDFEEKLLTDEVLEDAFLFAFSANTVYYELEDTEGNFAYHAFDMKTATDRVICRLSAEEIHGGTYCASDDYIIFGNKCIDVKTGAVIAEIN